MHAQEGLDASSPAPVGASSPSYPWDEEGEQYDQLMLEVVEDTQTGGGSAETCQDVLAAQNVEGSSTDKPKAPRSPRKRRSVTPVMLAPTRLRTTIKLTSDQAQGTLGSGRQRAPQPPPVPSTPKKTRKPRQQLAAVAAQAAGASGAYVAIPAGEAPSANVSLPAFAVLAAEAAPVPASDARSADTSLPANALLTAQAAPVPPKQPQAIPATSADVSLPAITVLAAQATPVPPNQPQQQTLPSTAPQPSVWQTGSYPWSPPPSHTSMTSGPPPIVDTPPLAPQQHGSPYHMEHAGSWQGYPHSHYLAYGGLGTLPFPAHARRDVVTGCWTPEPLPGPTTGIEPPIPDGRFRQSMAPIASTSRIDDHIAEVRQDLPQQNMPQVSRTSAPAVTITPPTPHQREDNGDSESLVGRLLNTEIAALESSILRMEHHLAAELKLLSLPRDRYLRFWFKNDARTAAIPNQWNTYEAYFNEHTEEELARLSHNDQPQDVDQVDNKTISECFKLFKAQLPGEWEDILETFQELQTTPRGLTMASRQRRFKSVFRKVRQHLKTAATLDGFHSALVICGNVVNQDASLGTTFTTAEAEDFFKVRFGCNDDRLLGHLKAHVYNRVSLNLVEAAQLHDGEGAGNVAETTITQQVVKAPRARKAITKDTPSESADVQPIKDRFITMGGSLGYAISAKQFPWQKMPKDLASLGLVLVNWPEGVTLPGKARPGLANPKGIADLVLSELNMLKDQLDSKTHACKFIKGKDAQALVSGKAPVVVGAPPPFDSSHTRGCRLFANGDIDRDGCKRLPAPIGGSVAPKNEPRALRGRPREVNTHAKQQSTSAEKSLTSTRDPTPPVTRGAQTRRSGKKPTTRSLAFALPPYSSDSEDQDYRDDDDVSTMTTSGCPHGSGDDGHSDPAGETSSEGQPPTTRSKAKGKAKARPRFPSLNSTPESEDVLVMKPESVKRLAKGVPEVVVKRRRDPSPDCAPESEDEPVAKPVSVKRLAKGVPEVQVKRRRVPSRALSVPESEDEPVTKPVSVKRLATSMPEVQVKRRRVLSIESDSSIEEIRALEKMVSKAGATKPDVVLSSRKTGKVAAEKNSSTTRRTAPIKQPKPTQEMLAVDDTGEGFAVHAAKALPRTPIAQQTTDPPPHPATSAAHPITPLPALPAAPPEGPQHPIPPPLASAAQLPGQVPPSATAHSPQAPVAGLPAMGLLPGQVPPSATTHSPQAPVAGLPAMGFPSPYPTHSAVPPPQYAAQGHPTQYPYYPAGPYAHPGYWSGGYPYMMPPPMPPAYGTAGYPSAPSLNTPGGSENAPSAGT